MIQAIKLGRSKRNRIKMRHPGFGEAGACLYCDSSTKPYLVEFIQSSSELLTLSGNLTNRVREQCKPCSRTSFRSNNKWAYGFIDH